MAANAIAQMRHETELDRRFREVDEFREALSDLSALMLPRREYESARENVIERFESQIKRIDYNTTRLDKIEGGQSGMGRIFQIVVTAIGFMITLGLGWLAYIHLH